MTRGRLRPDPGQVALRRGIRAAVVMVVVLSSVMYLLHNPQGATFAAFGSAGLMISADFAGEWQERLTGYLVMGVAGAVAISVGFWASSTTAWAVIATFVVGFLLSLAALLRGMVAAGAGGVLIVYIVAVNLGGPPGSLPKYLAGWAVAVAVSLAAALLVLPRHGRLDARAAVATAATAAADVVRHAWVAPDAAARAASQAAFEAALARLNGTRGGQPLRPAGTTAHDRALALVIDQINTSHGLVGTIHEAAVDSSDIGTRELAAAVATALDDVAEAMTHRTSIPTASSLDAARQEHRARTEAWVLQQSHAGVATPVLAADIMRGHEVRVAALATERLVELAREANGAGVEDLPALPPIPWRTWGTLLRTNLAWASPWFQMALRTAIGLALAVWVVHLFPIAHGFWVVLGVMSVLRYDAGSTWKFAWQAVLGTTLGVLLGSGVLLMSQGQTIVLWAFLPIVVFLMAWAPAVVGFVVGQAAFSMFVLLVLGISNWPPEADLGLVRVTDIAIGALVALAVGLALWPGGPARALSSSLATAVLDASAFVTRALESMTQPTAAADLNALQHQASLATLRAGETHDVAAGQRPSATSHASAWGRLTNASRILTSIGHVVVRYASGSDVLRPYPELGAMVTSVARTSDDDWQQLAAQLRHGGAPQLDGRPRTAMLGDDVALATFEVGTEQDAKALVLALWSASWVDHADRLAYGEQAAS